MNKLRSRKKGGFTLVELLVVLVIIGIIVAVVLPNTLRAIDMARRRDTAGTLRAITNACFLCFADKRNWSSCGAISALVVSSYLDSAVAGMSGFNGIGYVTSGITGDSTNGYAAGYVNYFPSWPSL